MSILKKSCICDGLKSRSEKYGRSRASARSNAGDAADQLARENLKQLDDASATLGQQLPAFPEVARSLKTQVAARFLLAKHRHFVEELYLDGFINEKVCVFFFFFFCIFHLPPPFGNSAEF